MLWPRRPDSAALRREVPLVNRIRRLHNRIRTLFTFSPTFVPFASTVICNLLFRAVDYYFTALGLYWKLERQVENSLVSVFFFRQIFLSFFSFFTLLTNNTLLICCLSINIHTRNQYQNTEMILTRNE